MLLQPLAISEFTELLTNAGAKREYCTQFFKAFDRNNDGVVDYDEFLIGMVAMVRCCTAPPQRRGADLVCVSCAWPTGQRNLPRWSVVRLLCPLPTRQARRIELKH